MGIFDTTANTGFNAFGNPLNSMNTNQGFGMNPNYLTPAFDAPYRPPYMGGQPPVQYPNPGLFRSAYNLVSPFAPGSPYGVGGAQQDQLFFSSGYRISDATAAFSQRFASPLISFGLSYGLAKSWQVANQSPMANSWMQTFGSSAEEASRVSGFTAMGQRFGSGLAKGIIGGASMFAPGIGRSAFAGTAGRVAGMLGGAAAGMILPAALAEAGIGVYEHLVSDNYNGLRENQQALRSNFSNVSFARTPGGTYGDPYSGQGLSRRASARMGSELTQYANRDTLFNPRELASMTNMASQMGMLDDAGADQIVNRMKSIMQQIKVVMSVAQTTDFKEAMEMMARLKMAGVAPGSIGSTVAGIGAFSSAAGISTSRMINTVGAQGQYLFQANGLTPYLGQITAANAMAGQAAAFRTGLVSPDMMARLGGVEGATQLSVTGQVNASQTTYNMMRLFNKYTSGTGGSGVIENVSNFGRSFAGNPLSAYGSLLRTGKANISKDFDENGILGTYRQLMDAANVNPMTAGKKIGQNEAFALLSQMGMSQEQAQAFINQMQANIDPRSRAQMQAGFNSNRINLRREFLEQNDQTYFNSFAVVSGAKNLWRGTKATVASGIGDVLGAQGGILDRLQTAYFGANYGDSRSFLDKRVSELGKTEELQMPNTGLRSSNSKENFSYNRQLSAHKDDIDKLKMKAQAGDVVAAKALKGDLYSIYAKSASGEISSKYGSTEGAEQLADMLRYLPRESSVYSSGDLSSMQSNIDKSNLFTGSTMEKAQGFQLAKQLEEKRLANNGTFDVNDKETMGLLKRFQKLTGTDSLIKNDQTIDASLKYALEKGINLSNDYLSAKDGEDFSSFMKRSDGRVSKGTAYPNSTLTRDAAYQEIKKREQIDRHEDMGKAFVDTALKENRLDLAAGYTMMNAAEKWSQVGDKWERVADKVLSSDKPNSSNGLEKGPSGYTKGSYLDNRYIRSHGGN